MDQHNLPTDPVIPALTTITVTHDERVVLARALVMTTAMVDALGRDTDTLMSLWERIAPEGEDPTL